MTNSKSITFATTNRDFSATLNKRVSEYFKSNGLTRHANSEMIIKTVCMMLLYFVPYLLIVTGTVTGSWWMIALVVIMSLGLAGIGLSVMHDANHGAYSKTKWVNTLVGYSLNMVGANSFNWKMQHNVLHHSYTNVHEEDEDISPRGVLRLDPYSKWKKIHRYQFIYAWGLYGFMTIIWLFFKDFSRIIKYQRNGLAKRNNANINKEWVILIVTKVIYIGYIFFIPVFLTSIIWWKVLIGIFIMHYIAGFLLAIIFQPAHVIEGTAYPLPDTNHTLKDNWAIHQLLTTSNFGNRSRWFSWYTGGLNFQIEHHLFPNICHVHYRKIAVIVKETAQEFGLPYRSFQTFAEALRSHGNMLKQLGVKPG
jgi:linoleoyl-CoA desaturase